MDNGQLDMQLSDHQQAILLLIKCGRDNEMNPKWVKQVESVEKLGLIQLKPNTKDEWMLTIKGEDVIVKSIMVKYPMESRGNIGSYNKTIQSMDAPAVNALVCAMINESAFAKVPEKTARVLVQHFLDTKFHHKWGQVLVTKVKDIMTSSLNFFTLMNERNKEQN